MVGKRAVQLWVVRSILRTLPFLASMAGQARSADPKRQAPSFKVSSNNGERECCAPAAFAASPV